MPFNEQLPDWEASGTEPPASKKRTGWLPSDKPPAEWFNWIFNRIYKVLMELRQNAIHKEEKGTPNGTATLGPDGILTPSQRPPVPTINDASTTQKGIVQLEDSVTSTSTTKAATANAVKQVKDSIPTLNNTVTSTSTTQAATANAVKTAYDAATGKYTKPGTGIPKADLDSSVQASLGKADSAYQKPAGGIPKSDLGSDITGSLGKSDDNGRYQAEFGLDGAVFSNCLYINGILTFGTEKQIVQNSSDSNQNIYSTNGVGQKLLAAFTQNMIGIKWVEVYVGTKTGSPAPLTVKVIDQTKGIEIGRKSISAPVVVAGGMNRVVFDDIVPITPGNIIQLRFDQDGLGDASNSYNLAFSSSGNPQANSNKIITMNGWASITDETNYDMRYNICYIENLPLSGTIVKTYSPSDLKKWGNAKWDQIKPTNTNVVCDVLKPDNSVLKAGITTIADLSDIDVSQYSSVKLRWTLTRQATTDPSPTVKNPSVTWEGATRGTLIDKITEINLTSNVTQIDITGIPDYERFLLITYFKATSTQQAVTMTINDVVTAGTYDFINSLNMAAGSLTSSRTAITFNYAKALSTYADYTYGEIKIVKNDTGKRITGEFVGQSQHEQVAGFAKGIPGAINKLSLVSYGDQFAAGSRVILYGLR